jgi:DNA-binding transcriptional regulator YiaG
MMTGQKFKSIREDLGMSQAEMARAIGVRDGRTVRYWEAGKREIGGCAAILAQMLADGHYRTIEEARNAIEG